MMAVGSVQGKAKAKPNLQHGGRVLKRKREQESVEDLASKVKELSTDSSRTCEYFTDLPLSKATSTGLKASHFRSTTDVQRRSLPLALKGRDILGAAKTGSGKTLAYLIPTLERLYRDQWGVEHGLAALILSPTRELAIQIFEVLRKIGRYHTFSAGLVIGGKSMQEERERLGRMNILVCTPGRILQHMDQTAELDVSNLKVLVLDEADRIMDMGFQSTVDAIVDHLPKERQTLLFSATQTKKVSDLARLSLKDPEYVSVHGTAQSATPSTLKQNYIVVPLPEKLDTLWSFIRANTKSKILVFLSSGKQVRFVFETFRLLQPGIPLMHLHGRQKQTSRLDITKKFSSMKTACLLATDVVARGLDFPSVDWVIQVDCPEDADTYIHRVGRTARYESDGRAVLFLEPGEEVGMLSRLEQKKIPIEMIKVRQKKQQSIRNQLQERCFKDPEIKYLGQKAFISYVRSIYVQPDKEVFKVKDLPLEDYASSLGLSGAPKIKFQKGADVKAIKNRSQAQLSSDDEDVGEAKQATVRTKYDRMFERQNQDILASHRAKLYQQEDQDQDKSDDDFLAVKRRLDDPDSDASEQRDRDEASGAGELPVTIKTAQGDEILIDSKRREKMLHSKKALLKYKGNSKKMIFDEDGNAREIYEFDDEDAFRKRGAPDDLRKDFVQRETARVVADDVADKQLVKDKRKERREKIKARARAEAEYNDDDGGEGENAGRSVGGIPLVPFESFQSSDEGQEQETKGSNAQPKTKKWFQRDSDDEENHTSSSKRRRIGIVEDAETLEDLEALAESYL